MDRLPAGDRRTVEPQTFGKHVLIEDRYVESDMLPLSAWIGKAEIDVSYVMVLDELQHILGGLHVLSSLSWT
ncbi:MAG: hypothetical protein USCAAHI_02061 [Beijerinckiaceae bacterium]|nr:MAG: hypothetical protein USCAAHI_02061 [Beijerinckiaceae bacterium]